MSQSQNSMLASKLFLLKLAKGEYGLANTFWYFGVLVLAAFAVLVTAASVQGEAFFSLILMIAFFVYTPFVLIGLIQSATSYSGKKIWSRLAMLLASLWVIVFIWALLRFVALL